MIPGASFRKTLRGFFIEDWFEVTVLGGDHVVEGFLLSSCCYSFGQLLSISEGATYANGFLVGFIFIRWSRGFCVRDDASKAEALFNPGVIDIGVIVLMTKMDLGDSFKGVDEVVSKRFKDSEREWLGGLERARVLGSNGGCLKKVRCNRAMAEESRSQSVGGIWGAEKGSAYSLAGPHRIGGGFRGEEPIGLERERCQKGRW